MDVWNLILYVVASLLALKSLASLMTHHKKVVVQQLAIEYTQDLAKDRNNAPKNDASSQEVNPASSDREASAA